MPGDTVILTGREVAREKNIGWDGQQPRMILLVSYICTWSASTYARYREKCRHVSAEVTRPRGYSLVWERECGSILTRSRLKVPRLRIKLKRPLLEELLVGFGIIKE